MKISFFIGGSALSSDVKFNARFTSAPLQNSIDPRFWKGHVNIDFYVLSQKRVPDEVKYISSNQSRPMCSSGCPAATTIGRLGGLQSSTKYGDHV